MAVMGKGGTSIFFASMIAIRCWSWEDRRKMSLWGMKPSRRIESKVVDFTCRVIACSCFKTRGKSYYFQRVHIWVENRHEKTDDHSTLQGVPSAITLYFLHFLMTSSTSVSLLFLYRDFWMRHKQLSPAEFFNSCKACKLTQSSYRRYETRRWWLKNKVFWATRKQELRLYKKADISRCLTRQRLEDCGQVFVNGIKSCS